MSENRQIAEVLCMALPKSFIEEKGAYGPEATMQIYAAALSYVYRQYERYPEQERPIILIKRIDSLITDDVEKVRAFIPGHECADCLEGVRLSAQHLANSPGDFAALANIYYEEVL